MNDIAETKEELGEIAARWQERAAYYATEARELFDAYLVAPGRSRGAAKKKAKTAQHVAWWEADQARHVYGKFLAAADDTPVNPANGLASDE